MQQWQPPSWPEYLGLVSITRSLTLSAALCMPSLTPDSAAGSLGFGGAGIATTMAAMGRLVAFTSHRGTSMRTSSGEPLATAAPGSNCCIANGAGLVLEQKTEYGQGCGKICVFDSCKSLMQMFTIC